MDLAGIDEVCGTLCGQARCIDAYLDTFSFEARPFYEKLGYRVFVTLENHPVGHQHYFMTKKLESGE